MTQSTFLAETHGSDAAFGRELLAAVKQHIQNEKASFHTPGHKGRLFLDIKKSTFLADLTELPGLDELANASGVLRNLQNRIASLWHARQSLISVNGASAALTAAILACRHRGSEILLPRNVHRSALNALIFSGLDPIWYEPEWLPEWDTWGAANLSEIERLVSERADTLAAIVVCSPNYAGVFSNIAAISSSICRNKRLPLIVDEAHGAHIFNSEYCQSGALDHGADLVIHSLHKTLSAPTQTGVLHTNKHCLISDDIVANALNTLQSSSPSYLLMLGIEQSLADLECGALKDSFKLASELRMRIDRFPNLILLEQNDPFHFLLRHHSISAQQLFKNLADHGIFAETILGDGVLLLFGLGSTRQDIDYLIDALNQIHSSTISGAKPPVTTGDTKPLFCTQALNPRQAFFAGSTSLPIEESLGRISSDSIAPCPPGYPLIAPGQLISREVIESLETVTSIRVVTHTQLEGDRDGSNTAS